MPADFSGCLHVLEPGLRGVAQRAVRVRAADDLDPAHGSEACGGSADGPRGFRVDAAEARSREHGGATRSTAASLERGRAYAVFETAAPGWVGVAEWLKEHHAELNGRQQLAWLGFVPRNSFGRLNAPVLGTMRLGRVVLAQALALAHHPGIAASDAAPAAFSPVRPADLRERGPRQVFGNCYVIAALWSASMRYPELFERNCRAIGDDRVEVAYADWIAPPSSTRRRDYRFDWRTIVVTPRSLRGSGRWPAACESRGDSSALRTPAPTARLGRGIKVGVLGTRGDSRWTALEKAYALTRRDGTYFGLSRAGYAADVLEWALGCPAEDVDCTGYRDEQLAEELRAKLAAGECVVLRAGDHFWAALEVDDRRVLLGDPMSGRTCRTSLRAAQRPWAERALPGLRFSAYTRTIAAAAAAARDPFSSLGYTPVQNAGR